VVSWCRDTDPGHLILWTVAEADPDLAGIAPEGPARRHASPDDPDAALRLYLTPLGAGRALEHLPTVRHGMNKIRAD
jgi:hypothetical protein